MKYIGLFDNDEDIVTKEKLDEVGSKIPTKTSQLTNDSGFLTTAPVTSVNNKTGEVTVREVPSVTTADNGKFLQVVNGAWAAATLPVYAGGVS